MSVVVRPNFARIQLSLDVGKVEAAHALANKFVITVQAYPFDSVTDADMCAKAIREAIESRLGIHFDLEQSS
jgi:hypothetical protein